MAESARREDRENLLARLVLADVYAQTGRTPGSQRGLSLVYPLLQRAPARRRSDPAPGRPRIGAIRRWNHNTQIFHFVVNTLCPDALKNDPNAWEAHLISGSLLLEKYNREQAVPELEQALLINPRAAEAIVLLGQDALDSNDFDKAEGKAAEALRINPRCASAFQLKADACFLSGRIDASLAAATAALAVNPHDESVLAGAAACALSPTAFPPSDLETWLAKSPTGDVKISRNLPSLLANLDRRQSVGSQAGRFSGRPGSAPGSTPPFRCGRSLLPPGDVAGPPTSRGEDLAGHAVDAGRPNGPGP